MNRVAAIVINRNTRDYLRDCLESLLRQDFEGGISVWVVDNGSEDGSPEMVLRDFPGVNLLWNTENTGYARACNQGIGKTVEPYLLILNSDTVLSRDTVRVAAEYLDSHPEAGAAAPRILNTDGTVQYSCREFPSLRDSFMHAFVGLFVPDNPSSTRYKKMEWGHDEEVFVDWVSGAFMALRREALEQVGAFDEGYFMYVEDVDLCWRLWQAGWKVGFVPGGDVTHHIGMSSRAVSTRMLFHHHRSMLRFHLKSYEGPARLPVNLAVAAGVAFRFFFIVALNGLFRIRSLIGGAARHIMPGRQ